MSFPPRRPNVARDLQMLDLADLAWPVTYTYFLDTPFGETQQHLTVNVPQLEGMTEATRRLGPLLWSVFAAPAAVGDVRQYLCFVTTWKAYGVPWPVAGIEGRGNLVGPAASRDNTPQIVMMTGHADSWGKRRLFMSGAPRSWSSDGRLTTAGWEALLSHAAGCMLGLAEPGLVSGLEWLLAYPNVVEASLANLPGVGFRRVTHLRVCEHTDKAPEAGGIPDL